MARLAIKLLGSFQVSLDGQPLTGNISDKGRALLAFLVLEADRPHRREALAEMLWPNQPHPDALANLRQSLHRLRRYLDQSGSFPSVLRITPQEIQFNRNYECWLDVKEFGCQLNACQEHHPTGVWMCEACRVAMHAALGLYKGDLLAGLSLPNCPSYDWWLLSKIEEYHRLAMFMLDWLVLHLEQTGNYSTACRYAQRAIELEPWCERSHRMKIRLLALASNPVAAIRQYETCRKILMVEMGVEPSTKTKHLMEQIRRGTVPSLSNLEGEYLLIEPLAV